MKKFVVGVLVVGLLVTGGLFLYFRETEQSKPYRYEVDGGYLWVTGIGKPGDSSYYNIRKDEAINAAKDNLTQGILWAVYEKGLETPFVEITSVETTGIGVFGLGGKRIKGTVTWPETPEILVFKKKTDNRVKIKKAEANVKVPILSQ